jgi:hypothetical protein
MTEINGNSSKTLPDPGNSNIYNFESCGAPGHQLDTLMTEKICGKSLPDPGNSSIYNLAANWILCL